MLDGRFENVFKGCFANECVVNSYFIHRLSEREYAVGTGATVLADLS